MPPIAIISDIHGNLLALQAVIEDIARRGATTVINLGDHASGPLWPAETVALLMEQGWQSIAGNHERQLLTTPPAQMGASDRYAHERLGEAQLGWLRALPATAALADGTLLCHGTPHSDAQYLLETVVGQGLRPATRAEVRQRLGNTRAPLILCGHTHQQRLLQLDTQTTLLNPGSVGLPAYEDDDPQHASEAGSPLARYALIERGERGWAFELRAVPYDHHAAADQAARSGRPDWEIGLRTGFMGRE